MCGISAGNNGYPLNESSRVAMKTIRKWLEHENNNSKIDKIVFVCFRMSEMKAYLYYYLFYCILFIYFNQTLDMKNGCKSTSLPLCF